MTCGDQDPGSSSEPLISEPTNWRHRVVLARIEAKRGNVDVALEEFRTGERLRPAAGVFEAPPE